jgi:hypothetical protein
VDTVFDAADYATVTLKSRKDFQMVLNEPECTNVCFWYLPPSLNGLDPESVEYKEKLHKVGSQSFKCCQPTKSEFDQLGCAKDQGEDDARGHHDGHIPAAETSAQLLQVGGAELWSDTSRR